MFIKSATFSISILPMALITLISYRYELRESQLDGRSELPVYNYVSDVNNLTWGQYMSLARQGYHEPFDKSLWWVHTHSTVPQSTHRYKYALFEFQFCGTLSMHESLPYAMARRRLIQMLKYCCIAAATGKIYLHSANTLKQCSTELHTHANRPNQPNFNQTETLKQNKNENDNATKTWAKCDGITKTPKNGAKTSATKPNRMAMETTFSLSVSLYLCNLDMNIAIDDDDAPRQWNPLDRIIVTGASRTL